MIRSKSILIVLILFFLLLRLSLLLFCVDNLCLYGPEEKWRGTIARDLIHGLKMPFFEYRADNYSGGSLAVGIITVPFFILFGENIISLKLTGILFFGLTLICLYLFCDKFFNRRIAVVTSLLFILPPQIFTIHSLSVMGFHSESILFSIILIFLFYQIFYNQRISCPYFFLFGLVAGLGLWFTYIFSVTLLTCLLFWFSFDRKFVLRKYFYVFLFGFFIGFSPWLWFNFTHNFCGLEKISQILPFKYCLKTHVASYISKFKLVIRDLFSKEPKVWDFILYLNIFYFSIFLISFSYLLWMHKSSISRFATNILSFKNYKPFNLKEAKYSFFLIYVIIFGLIFFFSNCGGWGRYLIPLFPFIFLSISFFLDRIWYIKIKCLTISMIVIALLIFIGVINQGKLFTTYDQPGKGFAYKGYSYWIFGSIFCLRDKYDSFSQPMPKYWPNLLRQLDAGERKNLFSGLFAQMNIDFKKGNGPLYDCITIISQLDPEYQDDFCFELGKDVAYDFQDDRKRGLELINLANKEYRQAIIKGFKSIILEMKASENQ